MKNKKNIALLGGGPSALFMFKRLVDTSDAELEITIFEKSNRLGAGMPYSADGANDEHITNVSGNEIPEIVTSVMEWIKTVPKDTLNKFHIDPEKFNDYKTLPRLLFGQYLTAQFTLLLQKAKDAGITVNVHYNSPVTDVIDLPAQGITQVEIVSSEKFSFDTVVISTGHKWPSKHEGVIPGYFDSPYPPVKLAFKVNHTVAVRGSSLTAVDAIRTLSRHNGTFERDAKGKLIYRLLPGSGRFKIIMHSRNGLLPAVRFHLEDSHLQNSSLLTPEEIAEHIKVNDGFLSLDYIFEKDFKEIIRSKEPDLYEVIKDMQMEGFVNYIMDQRESRDAFELLRAEYDEAERSIKQRKSIYWKELLGALSFALNYPAKHLSAEDMLRLQKVLLPLISVVIAYIPQSSGEEMMAMHVASVLDIASVGEDSDVKPGENGGAIYHYTDEDGKKREEYFETFVDSIGQPHLSYDDFPFKSLREKEVVSPARLLFRSAEEGRKAMESGNQKASTDGKGNYYLKVQGVTINDDFQIIDNYGALNERIYLMAVPYIGGYNPDYSGLDFCEAASDKIINSMLKNW